MTKFAVVLSGCGNQDGAEIHESVCTLLSLDLAGVKYECFAPDIEQDIVKNFITKEKMPENRNVLTESARIARGNIKDLAQFSAQDFDGIIFPGGMGAALNLSDFAQKGKIAQVNPQVRNAIEEAYRHNIVIAAECIAPTLLALVLGKYGIKITIGDDENLAKTLEELGVKHQKTKPTEACVDKEHKIVTTACYMFDIGIKDVFLSTQNLVKECLNLLK